MLYECNQPLVPLSKEIKMLRDYCALEKVRYDEHLDLQLDISTKEELLIAPLLLLPFVENSFKHGASRLVEAAWISLDIKTEEKILKMKLINSKPLDENQQAGYHAGIGVANVQTRLNLLYAGRHELVITNEAEVYIVNLTLELERPALATPITYPAKQTALYA
jgi:LytS/YehU family sensor histidine kinase